MSETKLPEKLSDLLRLAVRDAQACERDPRYKLIMRVWHEPRPTGHCAVCMAGAILAETVGIDRHRHVDDHDQDRCQHTYECDPDEWNMMIAVDGMRVGYIVTESTQSVEEKFQRIVREDFDEEMGRASWDTYLRAADYLESEGL